MRARVLPFAGSEEFPIREGCLVRELANTPDDPAASIAHARVGPGAVTRWHRLAGIAERYVILAGEGLVEVGELPPQAVREGDVVAIPPGCRQRIANTGAGDLRFLAVCTPRFRQEAYEDLGDESVAGEARP